MLLAAVAASCRSEREAVARVEVSPRQLELSAGGAVELALSWRILKPLEGNSGPPLVFVHLFDHPRSVARTFDHLFPARWIVGDRVEYEIHLVQSVLAPALPPGPYRLSIGILGERDERFPIEADGQEVNEAEYAVSEVAVPALDGVPRFELSSSWEGLRLGSDRQVLARRYLLQDGSMRVRGASAPGAVFLMMSLPGGGPSLRLASTCGAPERRLSPSGLHEVEVPVLAPNGCEIAFDVDPPGLSLEALGFETAR